MLTRKLRAVISVPENGLIRSDRDDRGEPKPDVVVVSDAAFQALRQLAFEMDGVDTLLTFFVQKGSEYVRVRNFVGLLTLPEGTQLEILPKVGHPETARAVLIKLLRHLRQSPLRSVKEALTTATRLPLWDVFIATFLDATEPLLRQGVQRAYVSVEGNERFWKGKFQATRQQRENSCHAERLAVQYDTLTANVPPNRILKTTLLYVQEQTADAGLARRIRQLLWALDEVAPSESVAMDLLAIKRAGRLFARYEPALRWAEALLSGKGFGVRAGSANDISLLFPMERVFEDYVANGIRAYWPESDRVTIQESSAYLVDEHGGTPKFKLRPDILIRHGQHTFVLDTKWKQIDSTVPGTYGIDQADLYQLYAYGKKYRANNLFLIYPANETFRQPLGVFGYDPDTRLHVVPFELSQPLSDEVEKLANYALFCCSEQT